MAIDFVKLSKAVSHALRHEPWFYGLELDPEGWAPVDELLAALADTDPAWCELSRADLARMIETSTKARHELRENRIRARYGHSTPGRIPKSPEAPPEFLYHGTSPLRIAAIRRDGLQPMTRQYVHLAASHEIALVVGRRKAPGPVVIEVLSARAWQEGVPFYRGNDVTWLADSVPPGFLKLQAL